MCCSIIYMPQTHWKKTWIGNENPPVTLSEEIMTDVITDSHNFTGYFLNCSASLSFTYTPHLAHTNYLLTMCPGTPSHKNQITAINDADEDKKNKNLTASVKLIHDRLF